MPSSDDIRRHNIEMVTEVMNEIKNSLTDMVDQTRSHHMRKTQSLAEVRSSFDLTQNAQYETDDSDKVSNVENIDASIDQYAKEIGDSSYWEYITDVRSVKKRRPTPIVCYASNELIRIDVH